MPRLLSRLFGRFGSAGNSTPPYQQWAGYPQSPVLTETYPYQVIVGTNYARLYVSEKPFKVASLGSGIYVTEPALSAGYHFGGSWSTIMSPAVYSGASPFDSVPAFKEANNPVYTDSTKTTVIFDKTT